jgi:hypothetical protein
MTLGVAQCSDHVCPDDIAVAIDEKGLWELIDLVESWKSDDLDRDPRGS